jgi:hypothetical protein
MVYLLWGLSDNFNISRGGNMKPQAKKNLSRREALKAIAAVTGVAALSSVKNKWETPLVQVGVLPAHAQASLSATLIVRNVQCCGPTRVTVMPSSSPISSTEIVDIPDGGSATFTLAPGTYDVTGEGECDSKETVDLDPGETEEVVVGCAS